MKMRIKKNIKKLIYWILPLAYYSMRVFPIKKNKIVICSYFGKGYGDHGKYIVEEFLRREKVFDIVWILRDVNEEMPKGVRKVKRFSIKEIYELCTAKVWIDNCRKNAFVRKRKSQVYFQTWHGDVGLKKAEKDAVDSLDALYICDCINDSKMIDYFLSGNEWYTEKIQNCYWYNGEILKIGSPRRDVLFLEKEACEHLKTKLNISGKKVVLYAPTFRNEIKEADMSVFGIDWERLLDALNERFGGEWIGLIRLHPNISKYSHLLNLPSRVVDVTNYSDMQELLLVSDVCISDYSSSLFEFAVTGKPGFIFATDFEEYKKDRDVYFDLEETPFSISENNDQLMRSIILFDFDEYTKENQQFYKERIRLYDKGDASRRFVNKVEEVCKL